MKFLVSFWRGLTYDQDGKFSTKRTAYVVSVIVTSYIVLKMPNMTWDVLTAYALHCTGPTSLREYLKFRSGRGVDSVVNTPQAQ